MLFPTTAGILSALTLFAQSSVASPLGNTTDTNLIKRANLCGDSTFYGETSGGSPYFLHCLYIRNNIEGDGSWVLNLNEERALVSWGNCKFVARTDNFLGAQIGNEDIRDLIWTAIQRFKSTDRVGARGTVKCQNRLGGSEGNIDWWLRIQ